MSSNTGVSQRIPSPRELQFHTQSIMQNALIKKKLEEQRENFRKRQEIHQGPIQALLPQLPNPQPRIPNNSFMQMHSNPPTNQIPTSNSNPNVPPNVEHAMNHSSNFWQNPKEMTNPGPGETNFMLSFVDEMSKSNFGSLVFLKAKF